MKTRVIPKVSVRLRFIAYMAIIVFSMASCDNGGIYEGTESIGNNDNSGLVKDEFPQIPQIPQVPEVPEVPQIPPPVQVNQTPVAGDFTINGTGTITYNGNPRLVTVTPKAGKSTGAITVKYNGNTVAPSAVGAYTVTFDVAEAVGWNAASGFSAGTLTIKATSGGGGGSGSGGSSGGGGGNGNGGSAGTLTTSDSFTVEEIIDGAPIINPITLSRTNTGAYPVTRPVSIIESDYDPGSIKWEIIGVGVYSGQTVSGNGPSFTLDARDTRYNTLGIHTLVLTVMKNGMLYQRNILFTIVK